MEEKDTALFESFTFPSGVTIENRLLMAPMTTNSSFINGMVTTDEVNYYKRRTKGLGAVITSCAQVLENGRFPGSLSAASDEMIPSLKKLADIIHENGTKAILQIFHVGRMGSSEGLKGLQPVSASAVASLRPNAEVPRALESQEVEEVIEAFGQATRRAIEAGFDGVELHGANTYLIQQFFSPHSNRREDKWGGTREARMKFPLAVVDAAKKAVAEHATKPFVLGYRISPEELENPGITFEDTAALLEQLTQKDLDYIHLSLGHYQQSSIRDQADKEPMLDKVLAVIDNRVPVIGVGQVHTLDEAAEVVASGASLVAVGRQLIVEPDWLEKEKNNQPIRSALSNESRSDLAIPDMMWAYLKSVPGWVPFK